MNDTTIHVRRAKEGNRDSLDWLFRRFSPLLLAQARFRLGGLDAGVAPEDVLHDVWAVALPAMAGLVPREGRETPVFLKFLSTTLLYRVNEITRRHIRQRAAGRQTDGDDGSSGLGLSQLPARTQGVLSRAAEAEDVRTLLSAIEGLPEPDRRVMVLRGIEQHSNQETAQILGQTPNAVSLRYNRVLKALQQKLGGSVLDELADEGEG